MALLEPLHELAGETICLLFRSVILRLCLTVLEAQHDHGTRHDTARAALSGDAAPQAASQSQGRFLVDAKVIGETRH